jgi:hypothetical protein
LSEMKAWVTRIKAMNSESCSTVLIPEPFISAGSTECRWQSVVKKKGSEFAE